MRNRIHFFTCYCTTFMFTPLQTESPERDLDECEHVPHINRPNYHSKLIKLHKFCTGTQKWWHFILFLFVTLMAATLPSDYSEGSPGRACGLFSPGLLHKPPADLVLLLFFPSFYSDLVLLQRNMLSRSDSTQKVPHSTDCSFSSARLRSVSEKGELAIGLTFLFPFLLVLLLLPLAAHGLFNF